jgi:hypothetical protein
MTILQDCLSLAILTGVFVRQERFLSGRAVGSTSVFQTLFLILPNRGLYISLKTIFFPLKMILFPPSHDTPKVTSQAPSLASFLPFLHLFYFLTSIFPFLSFSFSFMCPLFSLPVHNLSRK